MGGRRVRPRHPPHPQRGRRRPRTPGPSRAATPCWSSATGCPPSTDSDVASLAAARAARDVLAVLRAAGTGHGRHPGRGEREGPRGGRRTRPTRPSSPTPPRARATRRRAPSSPPSWTCSLLVVGWVGDSRAYWLPDDGEPRLLTDRRLVRRGADRRRGAPRRRPRAGRRPTRSPGGWASTPPTTPRARCPSTSTARVGPGLLRRAVELLLRGRRTLATLVASTSRAVGCRPPAAGRGPGRLGERPGGPGQHHGRPGPRRHPTRSTRPHRPPEPTTAAARAAPRGSHPRWQRSQLTSTRTSSCPTAAPTCTPSSPSPARAPARPGSPGRGTPPRSSSSTPPARWAARRSRPSSVAASGRPGPGARRRLVRGRSPAATRRGWPTRATRRSAMVRMDAQTRAEAKAAVGRFRPTAARRWAPGSPWRPGCSPRCRALTQRHAILLTDGDNQHETPEQLDAAIEGARGQFQCDCRGVGSDWQVGRGAQDRHRPARQRRPDRRAGARWRPTSSRSCASRWAAGSPSAALRVWAPQGSQVLFVRQVSPTVEDLTARRQEVNALTGAYPTGAWGDESRDYHVAVRLPAKAVGQEQLAARVQVAVGRRGRGPGPGQGDVVQRRHPDHAHRPGRRALHRAGRAGRGHPGRPGGQGGRRHRHGDGQAGPGGAARRRRPATRRRPPGCARSSRSRTPAPAPCASSAASASSTRWRSTPPPPRRPG